MLSLIFGTRRIGRRGLIESSPGPESAVRTDMDGNGVRCVQKIETEKTANHQPNTTVGHQQTGTGIGKTGRQSSRNSVGESLATFSFRRVAATKVLLFDFGVGRADTTLNSACGKWA